MTHSSVALLVDGDNFIPDLAPELYEKASDFGPLKYCRVYCNVRSQPNWEKNSDFKAIHAGSGKNAADILLVVEALELAYNDAAETFVLASSDGDLKHLICKLTELAKQVKWYGEIAKASSLTKQHRLFEGIGKDQANSDASEDWHRSVKEIIENHGSKNVGLDLSQLGKRMGDRYKVTKDMLPQKSWKKWLKEFTERYEVEERHVRLKS